MDVLKWIIYCQKLQITIVLPDNAVNYPDSSNIAAPKSNKHYHF